MSISQIKDKENVVYAYNGMLFSHKKRNPAICFNMKETWGYYAK